MVGIVVYLLLWLVVLGLSLVWHHLYIVPDWYLARVLYVQCAAMGGVGGALYCLRGVYLHRCVYNDWGTDWYVWYALRPVTSTISGFVSCVFLQAGVLVLTTTGQTAQSPYGYWALAFIAGYNVDSFLKKLEAAAQALWGLPETRAAATHDGSGDGDG